MGAPGNHPDESEGPQIFLKLSFAPSNSDAGGEDTLLTCHFTNFMLFHSQNLFMKSGEEMGARGMPYLYALRCMAVSRLLGPRRRNHDSAGEAQGT